MGGAGGGGGGGLGEGLAELADVLGFPPVFSLLEFPHAESDTTVAAVTAMIAN
jgi:hypothetical protein